MVLGRAGTCRSAEGSQRTIHAAAKPHHNARLRVRKARTRLGSGTQSARQGSRADEGVVALKKPDSDDEAIEYDTHQEGDAEHNLILENIYLEITKLHLY